MHHGQFTIHRLHGMCPPCIKCPPHFSGLISGISAQVAYREGVREGVREVGRE